jgi:hypothetical protein
MTLMKKFQRNIENFTCTKCGTSVTGDGYTNHCPSCLYSKHVDINPGDRAESCGGMMAPVGLEQKGAEWMIVHHCEKCSAQRRCKTRPEDMEAVLKLATELTHRRTR